VSDDKKQAERSRLGDFLVKHLPSIVIGMCAVIGFVWTAAIDTADLRHALDRQAGSVLQLKDKADKVEGINDRVIVQERDIEELQRSIERIQRWMERAGRWWNRHSNKNGGD
jgi:hypothetical protein